MARFAKLKPVVFLHLQKKAGTSIIKVAKQFYGRKNVVSHGQYCLDDNGQYVSAGKFSQSDYMQSRFGSIPFLSGHFGHAFAKQFMGNYCSFTFFRG